MTSKALGRNDLRRRRGQINQVFILIVAVIVIVATIALGAKLLNLFGDASCAAADSSFQRDLERALDGGSVYGSRDEIVLLAPCDAEELVLIDAAFLQAPVTGNPTGDATIDAALRAGVLTNAFVIVDGVAQEAGYDERIIVRRTPQGPVASPPFLKVPARQGRFTLLSEGYGRFVRVDES